MPYDGTFFFLKSVLRGPLATTAMKLVLNAQQPIEHVNQSLGNV